MDDLDFDPYASKRVDQERPPGPFQIREDLPGKIFKWKHRLHPLTKQPQKLIDFDWQKVGAERILVSFETYVQDWTLKMVKKREALDKADNRDHAQSLFASDRNGIHLVNGTALRALRVLPAPNANANTINLAVTATNVAQLAAIIVLENDAASPITIVDRPLLLSYCQLTSGEFEIFQSFVSVFNTARCHFFFDIISTEMGRYLNAERISNAAAAVPILLLWNDYRNLALSRLQDTKESEDLLQYLLKTRDELLPVYLWIAERRSERDLLMADGVNLPETTWLSYVLDFITNDERLILNIPADKDMTAFNGGAGYAMTSLETAVSTTDPSTFRKFHQSLCSGPLAKRILLIHKSLLPDVKKKVKPDSEKASEKEKFEKSKKDKLTNQIKDKKM